MPTALPKPSTNGRGFAKGGFRRALPLLLAGCALVSGGALTAQALYIPVKAEIAQVMLNRAFAASVESGQPVKPWSWADTAPMARVRIERLGVSEVVLSGGSGEAMAFGPTALVDNTARGVTVLAAHRDTHFEFVRDLNTGDILWLDRLNGSQSQYRITRLETVRWDAFRYPLDGGGGILALTTCYPFGSDQPGPLRRIAWAVRIT